MILFRHRKLGITSLLIKTEIGVDGITSFKLRDFVSNLFYHTRYIHTGDERKLVAPTFANKNVNRINRRSHHPNEDFIILRLWPRRIFVLQYLGSPRRMNHDRLHRRLSCSSQRKDG